MPSLWKSLEPVIVSGRETRKIDLKRELNLNDKVQQAKFAKDVAAMANTAGGVGYIVVGVLDAKERTSLEPASFIPGFECADADAFQRQMQQALDNFCNPPPEIDFELASPPALSAKIGVVLVLRSTRRPHEITRESGDVKRGIFIRRGAETFSASREELQEMIASKGVIILLNFGRPLSPDQMQQLKTLTQAQIDEIHAPIHFGEEESYHSQTMRFLNALGLTAEEWQTLQIYVNLPGLAQAAAAIIADLHGRMGHFPHILRMRPADPERVTYEIAEILALQKLRDTALQEVHS